MGAKYSQQLTCMLKAYKLNFQMSMQSIGHKLVCVCVVNNMQCKMVTLVAADLPQVLVLPFNSLKSYCRASQE